MGFTILGDPQYGTKESLALSKALGLNGQMLCAHSLEFNHPMTDQLMIVETRQRCEV
jgi:23S rRNA-/tRNA-specific pseudouridylate synthase